MSTAIAPREPFAAPPITTDQMDLIRKTVAKDATPDELKLYLYDCARQGVHPLDKLIHFTKRGGKYTPVTSIDFMRIQAANSGECLGISDPAFTLDFVVPGGNLEAATVTVKRLVQGQVAEFTATARWAEYYPGDQSGHMWKKMPHTMLGKCAEALALRKGFPKQLAGLYAREEMDQAVAEPALVVEAPKSEVVNTTSGEVIEETRPVVPEGVHWIIRCEDLNGRGKKKGNVTFSDGVTATIWMGESQLFDVCMDLCQRVKPVYADLKHKEGYAPTLKGVKVYEFPSAIQAAHEGEQAPEPPIAVEAKDLPF